MFVNFLYFFHSLHKAIIKLQRLNHAQHSSLDDWHLNMIEATKDLKNEQDQFKFIEYLANPSGYKENKKLWDQLEDYDKKNTRKHVQKMTQHDEFDWSKMKKDQKQIGSTMYIHVKNDNIKMNTIEEVDEKLDIPEVD